MFTRYPSEHDFIAWMRDRYPEMDEAIEAYPRHQRFDEQTRDVLVHFTPPRGECRVASHAGRGAES